MRYLKKTLSKILGASLVLGTIYLGTMAIFGSQETREQLAEAFKTTTIYNQSSERLDKEYVVYLRENSALYNPVSFNWTLSR